MTLISLFNKKGGNERQISFFIALCGSFSVKTEVRQREAIFLIDKWRKSR